MNRRSLALLAAAAAFAAGSSQAATTADYYAVIQQVAAAHARLWARLAPADRRLLITLAERLHDALRPNAHLPEDARRLIATAARGHLSPAEIELLADDASAELSLMGPRMTDMPTNFTIDYPQLRAALQDEDRVYAVVAGVLKTRMTR